MKKTKARKPVPLLPLVVRLRILAPFALTFLVPLMMQTSLAASWAAIPSSAVSPDSWAFLGLRVTSVALTWTTFFVLFIVEPLIDAILPLNRANLTPDQARALARDPIVRALPLSLGPFLALSYAISLAFFRPVLDEGLKTACFTLCHGFGLCASLGAMGTLGMAYGHECIHQPRSTWENSVGDAYFIMTSYPHFSSAHMVHHNKVGTREDPATPLPGATFWQFLPRTLAGSFRVALAHDRSRVLKNYSITVALYAAVWSVCGVRGALLLAISGAISIFLLEAENYIEHCGVIRKPGEPVGPEHSNNSSHMLGNALLLNLGRHSDHHMDASKRFYALEHMEGAPSHPVSIPVSILLALVPPVWRYVAHEPLSAHLALRAARDLVAAVEEKRAAFSVTDTTFAAADMLRARFASD